MWETTPQDHGSLCDLNTVILATSTEFHICNLQFEQIGPDTQFHSSLPLATLASHTASSLSLPPPSTCYFNHEPPHAPHSWWPPRTEFWRSAGSANSFLYFYFGCRGELLSLEDGTSSGGGQEAERTKREGPSEYEITLENKTKQVCFFYTFNYLWDKAVSICFRIRSCYGWSLDVAPLLTERTPIELYFCPCWHEKEHQRICHRSDRNTKNARLS